MIAVAPLLLTSPCPAQLHFTDVSLAMGVDYDQNDATLIASESFAMTGGAAAADYDGDGWTDLIVSRADGNAILFRNLGRTPSGNSRGFADVSHFAFKGHPPAARSNGLAWGDVDGDGDLDLYVTSQFTHRYHLYINGGNGRFDEEALARGADLSGPDLHRGFSASFADYDRAGYLDLYVTEWGFASGAAIGHSTSRLLRNLGNAAPGHFVDATDAAGVSVEASVAQGPQGNFVGVYTFTPRWADFDQDGWPDLALAGDFLTSRMFWNNGDGSFTEDTLGSGVGSDENGMGATVADFDGDGSLDWFITSIYDPASTCYVIGQCNWGDSGNRMYRYAGGRHFDDVTSAMGVRDGGWGWGTTGGDFDNDGDQDLVMTNGIIFSSTFLEDAFNADPMRLWRNDGGSFSEISMAAGINETRSGKGLLSFDFDRDGDLDLFVVHNSEHPLLLRNDSQNSNHWLQIQLRSASPNRFGIGARVKVWTSAGANPLVAEQSASSNFLGQNEAVLHFGLGSASTVAAIEVLWPSGRVSHLTNQASDRRLTIHEP